MNANPNMNLPSVEPVFYVGAERSGTTMFRLMLAGHPKIHCISEFSYAVDLISDDGQFPPLKEFYEHIRLDRIAQSHHLETDPALDYPELIRSFVEQQRQRSTKPIVVAKLCRHFERLLYIWPKARFIHLLRDGRDVSRSIIGMGWAGNVWTGSAFWHGPETSWSKILPQLTPDRYIEIRYEDLVCNAQSTLQSVCDFLNVPFDEGMLRYSKSTTYSVPDPTKSQHWRDKLSDEQVQLIEARIAPLLAERGYELSGLPKLEVTPEMNRRLLQQDVWYRRNFRLKRFGPLLFALDIISRYIKFAPLRRVIADRVNRCEQSFLK